MHFRFKQNKKTLSFNTRGMDNAILNLPESVNESGDGAGISNADCNDFETFVKTTLARMEMKIDKTVSDQRDFKEHLAQIEANIQNFEHSLQYSTEAVDELRTNQTASEKRIDTLEKTVQALTSQLNETNVENIRIQRYSRGFNLRFGGIKERPGENCITVLTDLLSSKLGFDDASAMIENAHRVAPASRRPKDGPPRHIIAKFLRRPERLRVILKARKALQNTGIFVTEVLCPQDLKRKREVSDVMKQAYLQGKKPRFVNGNLYIDGKLYKPEQHSGPTLSRD